ncbi:MAG: phosphotransferase [Bacteroidales bacterium]|nr:phosphotransferase [Bacteroidales bacterium]MCF8406002.1 phosphotransferase [Bacteroidales bacterium]
MEQNKSIIRELFKQWAGDYPDKINPFPSSGSNRKYFRLTGKSAAAIAVLGEDYEENKAFIQFSKHFKSLGLRVPEIYGIRSTEGAYLQEDLGDESLFKLVASLKSPQDFSTMRPWYRTVLKDLIQFQVEGDKGFDYSWCYPVREFGREGQQFDLNYFKYYFLKPSGISFNEHMLERDFTALLDYLSTAQPKGFMYRDFQSRNILLKDGLPFYIDYQGGRKGPVHYDVASLLFQAKATLPEDFRKEMLEFYIDQLSHRIKIEPTTFINHYYGFVLLRLLQVLGAYGYRGNFEQKPHFIESAGYALKNVSWFLNEVKLPLETPTLSNLLYQLSERPYKPDQKGLKIEINSFSYLRYGIPKDTSGHGGGFVFDCRSLPNPGRHPEYKSLTGRDQVVIDYLEKEQAVENYYIQVKSIVGQAVQTYLERGFTHLSISFGCTGGQHRSVYFAEKLSRFLSDKYTAEVILRHRMME